MAVLGAPGEEGPGIGSMDLEDLFATAPLGPYSLRSQIPKNAGQKGKGPLALAENQVGGAQVKLNWLRGLLSPLPTRGVCFAV